MSGDHLPPRRVAWWAPSGWMRAPWPSPYHAAFHSESDWEQGFRDQGYEPEGGAVPDERDYAMAGHLVLRRHADHLAVETWDNDGIVAVFFVSGENIAPFRATLLPAMAQSMALAWMAEEVRIIRRALVAIVRHGHGTRTVDPDGMKDRDERDQEIEAWERRRRAQAEKGEGA